MSQSRALVIGGNGGIGHQLIKQLQLSGEYKSVHSVVRNISALPVKNVIYHEMPIHDEQAIANYCQSLTSSQATFSLIVCTVGVLHQLNTDSADVTPEKRIEDLNIDNLSQYFNTNTIIPALWLKYVIPLLKHAPQAKLVFLNARVGSITDNKLGGWYGYRASKSAFNMIMKSAQVELQRRAKNICLISYHPGTVDTKLSKPFQQNVLKQKLFKPAFTVSCLLQHIAPLKPEEGPHYIDWQGITIPW